MHQSITPINITAAALIAQFCLICILLAAALLLRIGEGKRSGWKYAQNASAFPWYIAVVALVTIGSLLFTDQLSNLWKPLFGESNWVGLSWSTGIVVAFTTDLLLLTLLVYKTGGSSASPFNPVYSLTPVLAIFLREPFGRIMYYVLMVVVLFSATFFMEDFGGNKVGGPYRRAAYWLVSIASFALATYIGMITRPQ